MAFDGRSAGENNLKDVVVFVSAAPSLLVSGLCSQGYGVQGVW